MRTLFIFTALLLIAIPARAEPAPAKAPQTSPMRYTRINQAPEESTTMKLKTIKHEDEQAKQEPEEDNQVRIWNKYKALAAGKTEEEKKAEAQDAAKEEAKKEESEDEDSKTVEAVEKEEVTKEPERPTGIAAIIDEYKRNKAQRSQMHTITVTKPTDGQPEPAANLKEKPEG